MHDSFTKSGQVLLDFYIPQKLLELPTCTDPHTPRLSTRRRANTRTRNRGKGKGKGKKEGKEEGKIEG